MADIQQKTIRGPVKLTDVHSSGKSLAVCEGKNHYVDYGIPGEEVTFVSGRRKQGFRSGKVAEIVTPSPYRTEPFCNHHNECNGCPWQHISYEHQLRLKQEILIKALEKYEIRTPGIPPVIASPDLHYYRHRVEYAFAAIPFYQPGALNNTGIHEILGFHAEPGQVTGISTCYLQPQPSRAICDFVKSYAMEQRLSFYNQSGHTGFLRSLSIRVNKNGEVMVVIGFSEDHPGEREKLLSSLLREFPVIVSLNWTIHQSHEHSQMQGEIRSYGATKPYIYEDLGKYRFRIHASSFFQPNAAQAENIFQTIQDWAGLQGWEKIYDLYTGVGTIALFLANYAGHITGIEGSCHAIEDARVNARANKIKNVDFLMGDILETFRPYFIEQHGRPDVIVLDPPRSGTLIEIKKTINTSGAAKVIYLSCNPVSLAFDLKQLTEVYTVTRIQPFDMLPHTHHLETLVMLEKKA